MKRHRRGNAQLLTFTALLERQLGRADHEQLELVLPADRPPRFFRPVACNGCTRWNYCTCPGGSRR